MVGRDPYRDLAVAVLMLAVRDLRRGNKQAEDARAFLSSDWAAWLADEMDLDPEGPRRLAQQDTIPEVPPGLVTREEAIEILGDRGELVKLVDEGLLSQLGSEGKGHKSYYIRKEVESVARWRRDGGHLASEVNKGWKGQSRGGGCERYE